RRSERADAPSTNHCTGVSANRFGRVLPTINPTFSMFCPSIASVAKREPTIRKVGAFRAKKIRIKLKVLFRKLEMQAPGTPSVDQLLVLLTVVEEGSFTAAAKRLRRATSAISYAIDTLETQLGLALFNRGTTRKPKLSHVGEAIVSEAK